MQCMDGNQPDFFGMTGMGGLDYGGFGATEFTSKRSRILHQQNQLSPNRTTSDKPQNSKTLPRDMTLWPWCPANPAQQLLNSKEWNG